MATTLNYNVGVSTTQGVQALQNLQNKLAATSNAFGGLKSAITGLAVGGFIASMYQSAAAIKDVSDASGIGVQQLLGFQKAVKQFGGDSQGALDGISKLAQAIDGAANGSKSLQDRFLDLGITLSDLRNLTEGEILNKVVKNLGEGKNGAASMAAAIEIFGKKFKNVNFQDVAANLDNYTAAQKRAAAATIAADQAEENFSTAVGKFKTELLIALDPISRLASNLLEAGSAMSTFFKIAAQIVVAVLTFTAIGKAVQFLRLAFVGLAGAFEFIATGIGTVINFFKNFSLVMGEVGGAAAAGGSTMGVIVGLFKQFGAWILKNIPAVSTLGVVLYNLWDAFGVGIDKIKELLGLGKSQSDQAKTQTDDEKRKAQALREVTDAYAKQRLEIQQASINFSKQNKSTIDQINLSNSLIGKTKEYSDVTKAQEEIFKRAADESDKLREAKAKLSKEELKQGLGTVYDQQIAKIQEVAAADAKRVASATSNTQRLEAGEQFRLYSITNQIDAQNKLRELQDNIARSTMTEIQKKYYDIDSAARASAKTAIEAEEARRNAKMPIEEQQRYYAEAAKGNAALKEAAAAEYEQSRKFSTGWTQAFNEYVDNATNAATQAQRIFQTFTSSMEDMLMGLFKTGKLGWKDFIQTMIDELMRSQLRQLIAKTMGGMGSVGGGGSGGLLGGSIIPGFLANGGPATANKPYIVGERGPELFVPNTSGTVIPNGTSLGGGSVTYNINAVDAMSFKQMIAADPSFLHAVAEQGRRRIPGAR